MSMDLKRCCLPGGHDGGHVFVAALVKPLRDDCTAHYAEPSALPSVLPLPNASESTMVAELIDALLFAADRLEEFGQAALALNEHDLAVAAEIAAQYSRLAVAIAEGDDAPVMH